MKKIRFIYPLVMTLLLMACGGGDSPVSNNENNQTAVVFPILTNAPQFNVASAVAGDIVSIDFLHSADVSSITITVSSPDNCDGCLPSSVIVPVVENATSTTAVFTVSGLSQTSLGSLSSISILSVDSTLQTIYSPSTSSTGYYSERKYEIGTANIASSDTSFLVATLDVVNNGVTYFLETYCNASGTSNGGVGLAIVDAAGNTRAIPVRDSLAGNLYSAGSLNLPAGSYHLVASAAGVYASGITTYPIGDYNLYAGVGGFNPSKPVCGSTTASVAADAKEDADDVSSGATILSLNTEVADLTAEATAVINGGSFSYNIDYDWFVFTAP